jgi:hypothetical protein
MICEIRPGSFSFNKGDGIDCTKLTARSDVKRVRALWNANHLKMRQRLFWSARDMSPLWLHGEEQDRG